MGIPMVTLFLLFSICYDEVIGHGEHHRSSIMSVSHQKMSHGDLSHINKHDACLCVLPVQCPAHVRMKIVTTCRSVKGRNGICCKSGQNHTETIYEKDRGHHVIGIDPVTLGAVTRRTRAEVAELRTREAKLLTAGHPTILIPGTASYGHFKNSRMFNLADLNDVMNVATRALEIAIATRAFKDRQGITNQQLEFGMVQQDLRLTPLGTACAPIPFCPEVPDRYRRIDGACNNLQYTAWGAPLTPYSRLLPPSYQDGIWTPRVSEDKGQELPSPRKISTTLFSDKDISNPDYTLLVMQFGQFLSHDITQSIDTSFSNGSAISCCHSDGSAPLSRNFRHYACMPIKIPEDDPFYSVFKQGCMNFVRSVLAPRQDCTLGFAQQMNKITHFIDGSSIYGSTPEQTGELRSFENGRLNVFNDFDRDLLPLSKDPDACLTMEQGSACFTSGDTRTNQMVSLVVLHTIFMREHNRVAKALHQKNPHWTDEKLFLEARQVIIAELQVIVYKEYLPILIGDAGMEEFQLKLRPGGEYAYDYDPSIEPSITNEFASAALRFGHSTVNGQMKMYGMNKMEEVIFIPEVMFHPARMRKRHFMDQVLSTMTTDPMQEVDSSLSDALTRYMFRAGNPFGVDLISLNIQRGRDHGLRPYNDYRELVGLPRYASFAEFGPEMGNLLGSVYSSIDDVDLWVGGLLEERTPGSILGLVFRDIIADQFYRLKKGDKYFFENEPGINPGHFSPEQLGELRKTTMARIICDNSDGILLARQAPNVFRTPGIPGNDFVDCASDAIPGINFEHWLDSYE